MGCTDVGFTFELAHFGSHYYLIQVRSPDGGKLLNDVCAYDP